MLRVPTSPGFRLPAPYLPKGIPHGRSRYNPALTPPKTLNRLGAVAGAPPSTAGSELLATAAPIVTGVARSLARQANGLLDRADVEQELWLWVLKHPRPVTDYLDRSDGVEKRKGLAALALALRREGTRMLNAERKRAYRLTPLSDWLAVTALA